MRDEMAILRMLRRQDAEIADLRRRLGRMPTRWSTRAGGGGGPVFKLVKITGHSDLYSKTIQWGNTGSAVSTVVGWTYGGLECRPVTSGAGVGTVEAVVDGLEWDAAGALDSETPPIFNPHEFEATTAIVGGIEVDSSNFPAGNRWRPHGAAGASNAHVWSTPVWVTTSFNSAGVGIWVIVGPRNQFDGACT